MRIVAGMGSKGGRDPCGVKRSLTFEESTKIMKRILRRIKMISTAGRGGETENRDIVRRGEFLKDAM